ncbi:MAG: hypothetical protein INH37_18230, partial [Myxococcaceae bacterium]|nr:hypothetical protein [Myxococcaceae bacterium]
MRRAPSSLGRQAGRRVRRRAVAGLGLAVLVQACAAGSPVAQSPVLPLLVPWAWNAEGTGVSVSLWAFGVTADEAPPVVGSNGVVRAFEWQAPRRGVPVTARPLEVVTSTT